MFTISPRTRDLAEYWRDIQNTIRWSEAYGFTGILIFTGNDTYLEPWMVANQALAATKSLSPLVAVNPIYVHPFTAAKMVSSLVYLFNRRIYLNMVTGTAISYQHALGDNVPHDARYARLAEYIRIMSMLLASTKPVSFTGEYYQVSNLQLLPPIPATLVPEFFLAGQSEAARHICRTFGAINMQMLPADLHVGVRGRGIHFGIITRPSSTGARTAALALFPEDLEAQEILDYSMNNTDSIWKQTLKRQAVSPHIHSNGYWLGPFRNFKADCPYVVGSYDEVSNLILALVSAGIDAFVLDIPASEEEYAHLKTALSRNL